MQLDVIRMPRVRAVALNGYAYARGLANRDIDEALVDIDEALRRAGEDYHMIDTRGYLYYRRGDYDLALRDLDRAVEGAHEDYQKWVAATREGGFGLPDPREQQLQSRKMAQVLAVVVYHRGLCHQARGAEELAEKDFQRVRELGFEPGDALF
jgi:tetratricopeptide (TPR) repeat protein